MTAPQTITDKLLSAIKHNAIAGHQKIDANIFNENSELVKNKLAPLLRLLAVTHLDKADTTTSRIFRGKLLPDNNTHAYKEYLAEQAKIGTPGTDTELIAIGEAIGANIVVTYVHTNHSDVTLCLYLESDNAPTIHLYNHANINWSKNNDSSLSGGDGNSLFNAISEILQELAIPITQKTPLNSNSIFKYGSQEKEIIQRQAIIHKAVATAMKNQQTYTDKEIAYLKEEKRIRELPTNEKEQMIKDYALALQLARKAVLSTDTDDNNQDISSEYNKKSWISL